MLDRKANSVSDVCLPADKQNVFSFSRVSSILLWAVIISSNLRSSDYPEPKYMPKCRAEERGVRGPKTLGHGHRGPINNNSFFQNMVQTWSLDFGWNIDPNNFSSCHNISKSRKGTVYNS